MTSYVPEYLKARNRKTVFDLFLHERELSRAEIVQRTKMSFPTASKAVDFLISRGMDSIDMPLVLTGMIAIGIVGAILAIITQIAERLICPWTRKRK